MTDPMLRQVIAGRGFYYAPMPFITMKVSVESEYDSLRMKEALKQLKVVHPTINDIILRNDEGMWFKDTGLKTVLHEYSYASGKTWESILEDASKRVIDLSRESGVSFYVIDRCGWFDLMIACHHLYADGLSVLQLMDDLLYMYSTGRMVEIREPNTAFNTAQLPTDCSIPADFKQRLDAVKEAWTQHSTTFSNDTYQILGNTINQTMGYAYNHRIIRGSTFQLLKTKCYEQGITINAALTTAMVAALQKITNAEDGMSSVIAVSCREMLGYGTDKSFSNFSSCITPHLKYDYELNFWENAKALDKQVKSIRVHKNKLLETYHTFLELDENIFGAAYHARCGVYRDYDFLKVLKNALTTTDNSFDISNLRKVDFTSYTENFRIRDCYFAPNLATTCDYAFGVMSINKELTISLGYKEKTIEKETADLVLDKVLYFLSTSTPGSSNKF